jgi:anti-sigma28 factor (negative regulator of flagellin synthesis)
MVDPISGHPAQWLRGNIGATPAKVASSSAGAGTVATRSTPQLANLLALSRELSEQGPPVDYVRVAQVRRVITDQAFVIDARAIANAIVDFGRTPKS